MNKTEIEQFTKNIAETQLEDSEFYVLDARVLPKNRIVVLIDGTTSVPIEKCSVVNRALSQEFDEQDVFGEFPFTIEVSSAGITNPLVDIRQYHRHQAKVMNVLLTNGDRIKGKFLGDNEGLLTFETIPSKKKPETVEISIKMEEIKETKLEITF
jgi:ribosome maturation factor RimP